MSCPNADLIVVSLVYSKDLKIPYRMGPPELVVSETFLESGRHESIAILVQPTKGGRFVEKLSFLFLVRVPFFKKIWLGRQSIGSWFDIAQDTYSVGATITDAAAVVVHHGIVDFGLIIVHRIAHGTFFDTGFQRGDFQFQFSRNRGVILYIRIIVRIMECVLIQFFS